MGGVLRNSAEAPDEDVVVALRSGGDLGAEG
jgi:hypothetical protein